jgi:hypothetical protein
MFRTPHPLALTVLLAAPAMAQIAAPPGIIGFTSGGNSLAPLIQRQRLCQPVERVCPTGMASATGWAGGAAYNAMHGSLWHTQGTRMAEIRVSDCQLICSAAANLTLGDGSVATGLSICEARYAMYQLESVAGQAAVSIRHLRSCPPQVINACRFDTPSQNHIAGAVAVDDRRGLIYYATSVWNTANPANTILVAKLDAPCDIGCRIPVDVCGTTRLGPITAMTYDSCHNLLYVSDGKQVAALQVATDVLCSARPLSCCAVGPTGGATWHGFDIEPHHPLPVGSSCIGRNCRDCPSMALTALGDPADGRKTVLSQSTIASTPKARQTASRARTGPMRHGRASGPA